jgi:hypothetical protein
MRAGLRWTFLLVGMAAYASVGAGGSLALAQKVKSIETVDQRRTRLFKTPALAPLREPDRVEALPVQIVGMGLSSTFHVIEKPVALDTRTMGVLRKTLLNMDAYGGFTACTFDPAVAIRFHKGVDSVQVLICLMCGEVLFQDARGRDLSGRMWFRDARTQLLAAARKAFPKDEALRALTALPEPVK